MRKKGYKALLSNVDFVVQKPMRKIRQLSKVAFLVHTIGPHQKQL